MYRTKPQCQHILCNFSRLFYFIFIFNLLGSVFLICFPELSTVVGEILQFRREKSGPSPRLAGNNGKAIVYAK